MTTKLTLEQIPLSYSRCFQNDCPQAEACLHFQAGKCLNPNAYEGIAIFPNARTTNGCKCFHPIRPIKVAWGFTTLFADVKAKDEKHLRNLIKAYLGNHTAYYRYHQGQRKLTIVQQNWILDLFRKWGYNEPLAFDHYEESFDFTQPTADQPSPTEQTNS